MKPIGVGVISLGWMGGLHSRAYLALPPRYPELGLRPWLAHACDPDPERAAFGREALGFARVSADWRAVIEDDEVDVLSICAPNGLHREIALAAAGAGTPFWIEKPAGRDAAETADIAHAAAGLVTGVGFNYRHAPAVTRLRALVAGGELGRVTGVRCVFRNGQAADPRVALSWRYQRATGGAGVLGDLLCHVSDLASFVLGAPISAVSAVSAIVHPERPLPGPGAGSVFDVVTEPDAELGPVDNEDEAVVLARFAGGAIGTLEVSRVAVGPRCGLTLEVTGTRGAAAWEFERMNELRVARIGGGGWLTELADDRFGDYPRFQPGPGVAMGYDDLKVIEAARFLGAVTGTGRADGLAAVADALVAARVVDAAVAAAGTDSWVPVGTGVIATEASA